MKYQNVSKTTHIGLRIGVYFMVFGLSLGRTWTARIYYRNELSNILLIHRSSRMRRFGSSEPNIIFDEAKNPE